MPRDGVDRSGAGSPAVSSFDLRVIREYGVVIAFVALFITLSLTSDVFFTAQNMKNLAFQTAPVGIIAAGGTIVFIAGGFDLSVGAISGYAGITAAQAFNSLWHRPLARAHPRSARRARVRPRQRPPDHGRPGQRLHGHACDLDHHQRARPGRDERKPRLRVLPTASPILGLGTVWGINYPIFVWAGFAAACGFLLSRTMLGRYIYAVGGNPEAARLSGVRVNVVRTTTFAISGLSAGIRRGDPRVEVWNGTVEREHRYRVRRDHGDRARRDIAARRRGAIWRSVLGAFFLQMIGNGFNLLGTTPEAQYVIKGVILAAAVSLDAWARRTA